MTESTTAPVATVVISTKNRRGELARALRSALGQDAAVEVLVIDDGSTDGTAEMLASEFPAVRVIREARSAGLIVRRNQAADLARTPVLISLDDDAEFTSSATVVQVLVDLEAPRIGAVAMPMLDIKPHGPLELSPPARGDGVCVTATFFGSAYAIRRDLFRSLGGFRSDFFHQGEEPDLCLRMLERGWMVRRGRSDPIHHHEHAQRDVNRTDVYGRRNELLFAWANVPARWLGLYLVGYPVRGLIHGARVRRPLAMVRGILLGYRDILRNRASRQPVRPATMRLDRRLRAEGSMSLERALGLLHD